MYPKHGKEDSNYETYLRWVHGQMPPNPSLILFRFYFPAIVLDLDVFYQF